MPDGYGEITNGELYRLYQQLRGIIDDDLVRKDVYASDGINVSDKLDLMDKKLDGIISSQEAAKAAQRNRMTSIGVAIITGVTSLGVGLFNLVVHVH